MTFNFENIINAICVIFNNTFTSLEHKQPHTSNKNKFFIFTERERELIKCIYLGKERSDISTLMDISINTVDTMTKRVFLKMRVNTKVQLIVKITTNGWSLMFL